MSHDARKIPSRCPSCGESLSRVEMAQFLEWCEQRHLDPVALALSGKPPGVLCKTCFFRRLADSAEDGDPIAQRVVSDMRLGALGVAELPDGKPVVWH